MRALLITFYIVGLSNLSLAKTFSGEHMHVISDLSDAKGNITGHKNLHYFKLDNDSIHEIDLIDKTSSNIFKKIKGKKNILADFSFVKNKIRFEKLLDSGKKSKTLKELIIENRKKAINNYYDRNYVLLDSRQFDYSPDSNEDFLNDFPLIDIDFGNSATSIKLGFVRVNFNDSGPEHMVDYSQDIIDNLYYSHPHSSKNLYHVSTFGQIDLSYTPDINGKPVVYDAYLDTNHLGASCTPVVWHSEAKNYLASQGHDLSGYDVIVFYFPRAINCPFAGQSAINCVASASSSCDITMRFNNRQLLNHELGHAIGLMHSNAVMDQQTQVVSEYSDQSSMMGGGNFMRQLNAPFLDQLGLLDVYPGSVINITEPGTYTLKSVNQEYEHGSASVAKIELLNGKRYFVSMKSLTNYDQLHSLIGPSVAAYPYSFHSGANIHTQEHQNSASVLRNILTDGEQYMDQNNDVKITQISSVPGESVTVYIEPPVSQCLKVAPQISFNSTFLAYDPASNQANTLSSSLTVTNLNQGECNNINIILTSVLSSMVDQVAGKGVVVELDNSADSSFELSTAESKTISFHISFNDEAPFGYQRLIFSVNADNNNKIFNVDAAQFLQKKESNCNAFLDQVDFNPLESNITANIGEGAVYEFSVSNSNESGCAPRTYLLEITNGTNQYVNHRVITVGSQEANTLPIWLNQSLPPLGNLNYTYNVSLVGVNSFTNVAQKQITHSTTMLNHCPGDVDNDRTVGINDLLSILPFYGDFSKDFDPNQDYITSVSDLLEFASFYGNSCEL